MINYHSTKPPSVDPGLGNLLPPRVAFMNEPGLDRLGTRQVDWCPVLPVVSTPHGPVDVVLKPLLA
jgi:hypothetical protein